MQITHALFLMGAATIAGMINSVAGGGSLVSFPAAVAIGIPPLISNATNAVALTPGSIASAVGYRQEIAQDRNVLKLFLPAAFAGGALGSILLLVTPQALFDAIVPVLVFFATGLLFYQNIRGTSKNNKTQPAADELNDPGWQLPKNPWVVILLQFLVGVYGGYFGAGMGIMMLAIYTRLGGANIHRMNGVKSVIGAAINAIAAVAFVVAGAVDYMAAAVMAVGAIIGGLLGAVVARKVKPVFVRWVVVAIGCVLTLSLAYRKWG